MGMKKTDPLIEISSTECKVPSYFILNDSGDKISPLCEEHESSIRHSKIENWSIPRAVLRPQYVHLSEDLGPLFESFDSIAKIVKKREYDPRRKISEILKKEIDVGFESGLIEELIDLPNDNFYEFSILASLIYRIGSLEILKTKTEDQSIILAIQLMIDTHIDIVSEINREGIHKDKGLVDDTKYKGGLGSLYAENYPHDMRFYYPGDFPELRQLNDMTNIWVDSLIKKKDEILSFALCKLIITKSQICKCQTRNISDLFKEYLTKFPEIVVLFRKFILISMLGNYAFSKVKASFTARCHHVFFFGDKKFHFTDFQVREWIKENPRVVLFFVREFYMYLVRRDPVLDEFMNQYDDWIKTKVVTHDAGDRIRFAYSNFLKKFKTDEQFVFDENFKESLKLAIEIGNKEFLNLVQKLPKLTPQRFMSKEFEKMHFSKIMDKKKQTFDSHVDYIGKELFRKITFVVDRMYETDNPSSLLFVKTGWLNALCVNEKAYQNFREIWYEYCCMDMPDNSIKARIKKIYEISPIDFHVIRTFLHYIVEKSRTIEYLTSINEFEKQRHAYSMKTRLLPWEKIEYQRTHFSYCKNCKLISSRILNAKSKVNVKLMNGITDKSTGYNLDNGKLVCMNKLESACTKKAKSDLIKKKKKMTEEQYAGLRRKYQGKLKCSNDPVVKLKMFGTITFIDGNPYTLCSKCAGLIEYGPQAYTQHGITCGLHDRAKPVQSKKSFAAFLTETEKSRACYQCGPSLSKVTKELIVIDNKSEIHGIKKIFLCEFHHESVTTKGVIPTLTEVEESFGSMSQKNIKKMFI